MARVDLAAVKGELFDEGGEGVALDDRALAVEDCDVPAELRGGQAELLQPLK